MVLSNTGICGHDAWGSINDTLCTSISLKHWTRLAGDCTTDCLALISVKANKSRGSNASQGKSPAKALTRGINIQFYTTTFISPVSPLSEETTCINRYSIASDITMHLCHWRGLLTPQQCFQCVIASLTKQLLWASNGAFAMVPANIFLRYLYYLKEECLRAFYFAIEETFKLPFEHNIKSNYTLQLWYKELKYLQHQETSALDV